MTTLTRRKFLQLAAVSAAAAAVPKWAVNAADVMEKTNAKAVPPAPAPVSALAPAAVPAPVREVPDLATLLMENSIVRPRAMIVPMKKEQLGIPTVTASAEYQPDYVSGILPSFGTVTLIAHEVVALSYAADELTESEMRPSLAACAAWAEDRAFLFGHGWGMPLGAARSPATVIVPRRRKWRIQHWLGSAITKKDVVNMAERSLSIRGVWFVSMNAWPDVEKLINADGGLLGYPVVLTDLQPQRGYYGDVMLCDWSQYVIGNRGATIESADHVRFDSDLRDWRIVDRIDGKPWVTAPVDGYSPFVVLDGRPWADSGIAPDEPPEGWMDERVSV